MEQPQPQKEVVPLRPRVANACEACRFAKVKCQESSQVGICKRLVGFFEVMMACTAASAFGLFFAFFFFFGLVLRQHNPLTIAANFWNLLGMVQMLGFQTRVYLQDRS